MLRLAELLQQLDEVLTWNAPAGATVPLGARLRAASCAVPPLWPKPEADPRAALALHAWVQHLRHAQPGVDYYFEQNHDFRVAWPAPIGDFEHFAEPAPPSPTADEVLLLDRLTVAVRQVAATLEGPLWAHERLVYESPEDDGVRSVLADRLLEAGDPRGELIALQLSPQQSAERQATLLARYHVAWSWPLAGALAAGSVEWRRGFPSAGRIASDEVFFAVAHVPHWATFERLDFRELTRHFPELSLWFAKKTAKGLAEVDNLDVEVLRSLATLEVTLPWRRLSITGYRVGAAVQALSELDLPRLDSLAVRPKLEIDFSERDASGLLKLREWKRLELPLRLQAIATFLKQAAQHRVGTLQIDNAAFRLTHRPKERTLELALQPVKRLTELNQLLDTLEPSAFSQVVVRGPERDLDDPRVKEAMQRLRARREVSKEAAE